MGDWEFDGLNWIYHPDRPTPDPNTTQPVITVGEPVDVPPRIDDWCENRHPDDITAEDGR